MQAPPTIGGPEYQHPTSVTTATTVPPHKAPHDFLCLAVFTTIVCLYLFLNFLSLGFGIPAIIFSTLVSHMI